MSKFQVPAFNIYEEISRRFVSKRAGFFEYLENERGKNSFEVLLQNIPLKKSLKILDVGCGDGNLQKYINFFIP